MAEIQYLYPRRPLDPLGTDAIQEMYDDGNGMHYVNAATQQAPDISNAEQGCQNRYPKILKLVEDHLA